MTGPAEQIAGARKYIKRTYSAHPATVDYGAGGKLPASRAAEFYEEDEPPEKIFAAFDQGEKGVTVRPGHRP